MFLFNSYYLDIFDTLKGKLVDTTMKRNTKLLFTTTFIFCLYFVSKGQMIWPGDVNDNGVVNGIDALYIGVAFGSSGPARPGGNEDWEAQLPGDLWGQLFPDLINFAYADCDGNGIIEDDDIKDVIEENFFLTHGVVTPDNYDSGATGDAPILELVPQNSNVTTGEMIFFDVMLGNEAFPVEDFYGIAIVMNYNPDFTLGSEWEFEEESNVWYDPTDDNSEHFLEADESAGKMELVITRTNQQSINGSGKIGEVSIVIEDIVFGLQDTLNLQIEGIHMIDKDFNTLSVVPDSTFVIISKPNKTMSPENAVDINISPNPTDGTFNIISSQEINGIELLDVSGRKISISENYFQDKHSASVTIFQKEFTPQLYFVKIRTTKGVVLKKIIVI
jgi:hypothetical protein